jgi:hypothetical protein
MAYTRARHLDILKQSPPFGHDLQAEPAIWTRSESGARHLDTILKRSPPFGHDLKAEPAIWTRS